MAMTLPSPASDAAHPSPASPPSNSNNNNDSAAQNPANNSAAATNPNNNNSSNNNAPKRKPSRRANTAERRATHNAVERQRRETLNGRFLDLAALLPNLSQIRRPSKSSIVNSSIAHIQASRRHRAIASRELRMLKHECDALRRELNEWRDRTGLPHVQEPVRGEGFGMVLSGELEVIQGVSVEEEDEDGDDAMGLGGAPGMHQQMQQSYTSYMDDVDDDPALLGPMYPSHQGGMPHHGTHGGPHHAQHQPQQQSMNHHSMMGGPQSSHDLDDPRMAAMLLKNASNPFAHNIPPPSNSGYPPSMGAGRSNNSNYDNWGASAGFGGPNGPAGPGFGSNGGNQAHLFTPPATSHGLPTVNTSAAPASSASNASSSGSPVGGMSVNQQQQSPVVSSHGSPLSNSGGIPLAVMHQQQAAMAAARRERSGSVMSTNGGGNGGNSPSYELHHPSGGPGEFGVPRRGGDYLGGMMGPGGFGHGSHHSHHGHGGMQPQAVGAGGISNGAMMMMMM